MRCGPGTKQMHANTCYPTTSRAFTAERTDERTSRLLLLFIEPSGANSRNCYICCMRTVAVYCLVRVRAFAVHAMPFNRNTQLSGERTRSQPTMPANSEHSEYNGAVRRACVRAFLARRFAAGSGSPAFSCWCVSRLCAASPPPSPLPGCDVVYCIAINYVCVCS